MLRGFAKNAYAVLGLLVALQGASCFREPSVNKMKCTPSKGCPSGYSCVSIGDAGWHCLVSGAGPDGAMRSEDLITPSGGDVAKPDSADSRDDSIGRDGAGGKDDVGGMVDGSAQETSADDAPVPQTDGPAVPTDGKAGSDGASAGGAMGTGGVMVGTGGAGGMGGTGGILGTGGATVRDGGPVDVLVATDAIIVDGGSDTPVATGGVNSGGAGGLASTGGNGGGASSLGGASSGGVASGGAASGGATTGGSSGGTSSVGGAGSGGATGGTSAVCQENATKCSGDSLQTCVSGQWGGAQSCGGARRTCTEAVGSAACTCKTDSVCSVVGQTCASTTTRADCRQDADSCLYVASTETCNNGACTGVAGAAQCCTNACAIGAGETCQSGTSIRICSLAANGCTAYNTTNCPAGEACKRYSPAVCLDPDWAEWRMPNTPGDVSRGAPSVVSYTDNNDGTITDNVTGLIWQKDPSTTALPSFSSAISHCASLSLAGHNDWRLPSRIELTSIVDIDSYPAINSIFTFSMDARVYWTSTIVGTDPSLWGVWIVVFSSGRTTTGSENSNVFVRCVR